MRHHGLWREHAPLRGAARCLSAAHELVRVRLMVPQYVDGYRLHTETWKLWAASLVPLGSCPWASHTSQQRHDPERSVERHCCRRSKKFRIWRPAARAGLASCGTSGRRRSILVQLLAKREVYGAGFALGRVPGGVRRAALAFGRETPPGTGVNQVVGASPRAEDGEYLGKTVHRCVPGSFALPALDDDGAGGVKRTKPMGELARRAAKRAPSDPVRWPTREVYEAVAPDDRVVAVGCPTVRRGRRPWLAACGRDGPAVVQVAEPIAMFAGVGLQVEAPYAGGNGFGPGGYWRFRSDRLCHGAPPFAPSASNRRTASAFSASVSGSSAMNARAADTVPPGAPVPDS